METCALDRKSDKKVINQAIGQIYREQHNKCQQYGPDYVMQPRLLPDFDQIDPVGVGAGQVLLVLDSLIEIGQIFLIDRNTM